MLLYFTEQVFFSICASPICFYETMFVFNLERLIVDDSIPFKHQQSFYQVQIVIVEGSLQLSTLSIICPSFSYHSPSCSPCCAAQPPCFYFFLQLCLYIVCISCKGHESSFFTNGKVLVFPYKRVIYIGLNYPLIYHPLFAQQLLWLV